MYIIWILQLLGYYFPPVQMLEVAQGPPSGPSEVERKTTELESTKAELQKRMTRVTAAAEQEQKRQEEVRSPMLKKTGKSRIGALRKQVEDVKSIMSENISKVAQRGEKMADLDERAEHLSVMADMFQKRSRAVEEAEVLEQADDLWADDSFSRSESDDSDLFFMASSAVSLL